MIFSRPRSPRACRRSLFSIRVVRAFSHSVGEPATNPLTWVSTISALTPTGDTMAGMPRAMYCSALKPHLPLAQMSSVSGMMPISNVSRSGISLSFVQGTKRRFFNGSCGSWLAMTIN